ncbi:hypothetical protein R2601_04163 [Salipiger bermudensis HTCC2601]|uniref:Uncharacterized protein n=1 Tax=Salipiger bermudensis (strain DSM 26914 / JCM 13377 / KCTC 12554 / HTCC2601) TaxID=314265 RepID=Q0FW13_SALBH|nr:hypothetical protein R2601_04163 [Salipiger bermudensis HTCC2601]
MSPPWLMPTPSSARSMPATPCRR